MWQLLLSLSSDALNAAPEEILLLFHLFLIYITGGKTQKEIRSIIFIMCCFFFFLPLQEDVSCHASKDSRSGPSSAVLHRHGHRARGQQEIQVPAVNVTVLTSTSQCPDQRFLFERSCRKQALNFMVFARFMSHFIPLANAQMHPGVSLPNEA